MFFFKIIWHKYYIPLIWYCKTLPLCPLFFLLPLKKCQFVCSPLLCATTNKHIYEAAKQHLFSLILYVNTSKMQNTSCKYVSQMYNGRRQNVLRINRTASSANIVIVIFIILGVNGPCISVLHCLRSCKNKETGPYNILSVLPFHLGQVHAAVTGFLPLLALLVLQEETHRGQEEL